jgi:hypothetical protein
VKRTDRDEPICVVIHIYMETTQGISLYSYFYLKLAKKPCFSYYLLCFFFYKIGKQKVERVLLGRGEIFGMEGGGGRKRGRRVNMVQIMYTHI